MTDDAGDDVAPSATRARPRWRWLRPLALVLIVLVLGVELVLVWDNIKPAWDALSKVQWEWLVACVVAVWFSFDSYAQVIRVLLRNAGVKVSQFQALGLQFASNSVSQSLPGGMVLAPTLVYRRTRQWGATPVIAAWQIVMSGLLAAAGLAVLGILGATLAGARTSPFSVAISVALVVGFIVLGQYVASHPDGIFSVGERVIRWYNSARNKPADDGIARWQEILDQLGAVRLKKRYGIEAFVWSMFNWVADVACLLFACYAVGGQPGLAAICVAYAAQKAVGGISPIPGGIGLVEAALVPALYWAGMPAGTALTAVIIYRVISYFLVVAVGWVVFFFGYRDVANSIEDDGDDTHTKIRG